MYFCIKSLDLIDLVFPFWISSVHIYTMCSNRSVYMKFLFSGVYFYFYFNAPSSRRKRLICVLTDNTFRLLGFQSEKASVRLIGLVPKYTFY